MSEEYAEFHAAFDAVSGDVLNVPAARDMFRHGWTAGKAFEAAALSAAQAEVAALRAYAMALRGDLVAVMETEDYTYGDTHMQGTLDEDVAALAATQDEAGAGEPEQKVVELKRLLDRAYPWLHNPYTPSQDALLCAQFDAIKRAIQAVIAHLPELPEPPVTLPCGSCDGVGCPNCIAAPASAPPAPRPGEQEADL